MEDLSLHILDVAENSVAAGATRIAIVIIEDSVRDALTIEITDNGRGMDARESARAVDPFYTTRTTRRVGLGLPLLESAAREANGTLAIQSEPGTGTSIVASFQLSHIDRKPLGRMADTISTLVAGSPEMELSYRHERDGRSITFTTGQLRRHLNGRPANSIEVLRFIREYVAQEEERLSTKE